jgi:hypothetical protein
MTALLRTGKFLRLVSGIARSNVPGGGGNNGQQNPNGGAGFGAQHAEGYHLMPALDGASPFQAWSVQQMQSALPALTVSREDDGNNEEEMEILAEVGSSITKEEIKELTDNIQQLDNSAIAQAQSVLVLRLCGSVLATNVPDKAERTELANEIWTRLEEEFRLPMTTAHYNALLSVYIENGHTFCPEYMQNRLRRAGVRADRDTYENLLTKYCQDGNMEGANGILKVMRDGGHAMGRHNYHALMTGHAVNGDMKSARNVLDSMDVEPNVMTYATLCRGHALQGDVDGMERAIKICTAKGMKLTSSDYLDMVEAMCEGGHKEHVSKILAKLDDAEDKMAKKSICRLIGKGHDDVAFSLMIQMSKAVDNSTAGRDFLEQLVRSKRPVTKLLWFAEEMSRKNVLQGGMETLLQAALQEDNFPLSLKLAEIYVQEGHALTSDLSASLLKMCGGSSLDVLSTVRVIGPKLTGIDIKEVVLPHLEHVLGSGEGELLVQNLEKTGLKQDVFVGPLVDYLVEKGREQDAARLALERSQFLTDEQKQKYVPLPVSAQTGTEYPDPVPEFVPSGCSSIAQAAVAPATGSPATPVPMVKIFDANVNQFSWAPVESICQTFRIEGRFWDLEQLLTTSGGSLRGDDRKIIYMYTLQCYLDHGFFDKAIFLSRQLEKEGLAFDFPEYHQLMARFQETFMTMNTFHPSDTYIETDSSFYPAVPSSASITYAPSIASTYGGTVTNGGSVGNYTNSESSFSVPATPSSEMEEQMALQTHYHKFVKKAIVEKKAEEAYSFYIELEKTGKQLNVTESSSLIELLVKDGTRVKEAARMAEKMLVRETYPMPKIFRYCAGFQKANLGILIFCP